MEIKILFSFLHFKRFCCYVNWFRSFAVTERNTIFLHSFIRYVCTRIIYRKKKSYFRLPFRTFCCIFILWILVSIFAKNNVTTYWIRMAEGCDRNLYHFASDRYIEITRMRRMRIWNCFRNVVFLSLVCALSAHLSRDEFSEFSIYLVCLANF